MHAQIHFITHCEYLNMHGKFKLNVINLNSVFHCLSWPREFQRFAFLGLSMLQFFS